MQATEGVFGANANVHPARACVPCFEGRGGRDECVGSCESEFEGLVTELEVVEDGPNVVSASQMQFVDEKSDEKSVASCSVRVRQMTSVVAQTRWRTENSGFRVDEREVECTCALDALEIVDNPKMSLTVGFMESGRVRRIQRVTHVASTEQQERRRLIARDVLRERVRRRVAKRVEEGRLLPKGRSRHVLQASTLGRLAD